MSYAVVSWKFPIDLSIVRSPLFTGAYMDASNVQHPSVVHLTDEHVAALQGLAANDHRKVAFGAMTLVNMGEPTVSGHFALDRQAALASASRGRKAAA